jgi:polyhydroxyalkanoate synthesis regulator phasin
MNSDTLMQMLQNGFRLTLGATTSLIEVVQDSEKRTENLTRLQQEVSQTATSLVEAIQDPQKREANLTKLRQEWHQLSEEWVAKGEITEQEARNFVNNLLSQRSGSQPGANSGAASTTTPPTTSPEVQTELQELIDQIAALRIELENERKSGRPEA